MFDDNMLLCCDSAEFHVMTEILERQQRKTNKKPNTKNKKENKMAKTNIVTIIEDSIITGVKYGTVEAIVDAQPQSQTTDKETLLNKHKQQQVLKNNNIIRQRMQCK
ncbi:MAG: hypothetical protein IKP35_04190 [Alphaproteobacteria bacterium]|nr:hypothetical protein [Alphaproteobacteria bacterium]